jgi:hypothetical protein
VSQPGAIAALAATCDRIAETLPAARVAATRPRIGAALAEMADGEWRRRVVDRSTNRIDISPVGNAMPRLTWSANRLRVGWSRHLRGPRPTRRRRDHTAGYPRQRLMIDDLGS